MKLKKEIFLKQPNNEMLLEKKRKKVGNLSSSINFVLFNI